MKFQPLCYTQIVEVWFKLDKYNVSLWRENSCSHNNFIAHDLTPSNDYKLIFCIHFMLCFTQNQLKATHLNVMTFDIYHHSKLQSSTQSKFHFLYFLICCLSHSFFYLLCSADKLDSEMWPRYLLWMLSHRELHKSKWIEQMKIASIATFQFNSFTKKSTSMMMMIVMKNLWNESFSTSSP
jgi:hypothetical protein